MSHLLTRMADRALGIASTIEPVRSPMFGGEYSGYGEPAEHEATGFVYGDIVTSTQKSQPPTRETSVGLSDTGLSDTVASQVEQWSIPDSPAQPVESRVLHEPSAADVDNPFTRSSNSQHQSHDFMDSSVLVGSPPRLTETVAANPEPPATALSPVTSHASRSIDSHSPAGEQVPEAVDGITERQSSPGSFIRPRVSPVPSFPARPTAIDSLPQERNNIQTLQPAIQVTIGRIEVRAVTTPPPQTPRERKKPQPSLSLDDYLKQRAEGQR